MNFHLSNSRGAGFIGILVALVIVALLVLLGSKIYFKGGSMDTAAKQLIKSEGMDTSKSYIDHAKGAANAMDEGIKKEQDALDQVK